MEKTDVILVLGHRLLPDDTPSEDLKRRIDKAVELWKETGASMIMPCGGLTRDRHRTEAEVMKEMLMERGVPSEQICLEDKSRITLENLVNACDLVGTEKRVAIVSSDYHMDMAMKDAEAVGLNAYGVGAETPDESYREQTRAMLNGFEEKLDMLRRQGFSNREVIRMCMENMSSMQKGQDHFTVAEMLEMQKTLRDKYTQWERYSPEAGPNHLLWMIGEVGEVIDIVKKCGAAESCKDPNLRSQLVEEMADVLMYYNDVLWCFGITEKELKESYLAKYERNLHRW
ncbi:MAG: YdcF family protein [Clostridiales bacterium]|nr:YdcF family protein [Clostridiales bacterium]